MQYLFDKVAEFTEKFNHLFIHKKKILALENFSQALPFYHRDYLVLIKRCVRDGFLTQEETTFLVYLVNKYFGDKNFLDWTHRTPWLKQEMSRQSRKTNKVTPVQHDLFNWSKMREQHAKLTSNVVAVSLTCTQRQARA